MRKLLQFVQGVFVDVFVGVINAKIRGVIMVDLGRHGMPNPTSGNRMKSKFLDIRASANDAVQSDKTTRIFDLVVVVFISPILLPLMLIAAIIIKLENPREPAFFLQTRYGLMGKPFKIIKLRTMEPDAEQRKHEFLALSVDQGPGFKIPDDPRVSRVGRTFRKLNIDEIPQLLNVVAGDMSIVGPRPNSYPPETYEPWQRVRTAVKPGMTGLWQIARDRPASFDERCKMDIDYITRQSIWLDLHILWETAKLCVSKAFGG